MSDLIQLKRGPKYRWEFSNPVLAYGEPGFEVDTNVLKIGDGVSAWRDLPSISPVTEDDIELIVLDFLTENPAVVGASVAYVDDSMSEHRMASTPHPSYDDVPSFVVLFENGLV